jgi:peptide/nickel transport system substrate-binding protein
MVKKLLFCLVLVLGLSATALAQEPGSGGPIIEGNISGSANIGSFNPIRCSGTDCQRIYGLMFPSIVGLNPETGQFTEPGEMAPGSLATNWTVSEDGLEYTFTLRDDIAWTDGTPITAGDMKFTYDAIASGEVESDFTGYVDALITAVDVIDDQTIKFTMASPTCNALGVIAAVYPLPAHYFENDYLNMVDSEYDRAPSVTAGPFQFERFGDGQVVLVPNQDFPDLQNDMIIPEGFIYLDVADTNVAVERLLAGEINFLETPQRDRREELKASEDIQTYEFGANGWNYIALNAADPENPQNGLDEEGNPIDQGQHPLFGEVNVRRALQYGLDVQEMIEIVSLNQGIQMAANELPTSWALNEDLAPIPHDPEMAGQMLDEAGWPLGDDGVRVCEGCGTAEDGTPFAFDLIVYEGSVNAERIGLLMQDQLSEIGVEVELRILEFNTAIGEITGQTFDAALMSWSNSWPADPDVQQIFSASVDVVGSGFNMTSYNSPEMEALNDEANTLPGCDLAERAALYGQAQEILQADQPYLWLYTANDMYAARAEVEGFAPYPNSPFWNVETWEIAQP